MSEFAIKDLQSIFLRLNAEKWAGILIGGQAVNLYAIHFAAEIPDIRDFDPLTSRDLDFHGGPKEAKRAMRILNAQGKINDGTDPSPNAGVLQVAMENGDVLIVDILTSVFGVSASEMIRTSVVWQAEEVVGRPVIQVIHPLLLMESKLACLRSLPQLGRQDEKHVRLLVRILNVWLSEQLQSPRSVFRSIERLAAQMMTPDGLAAFDRKIELWDAIPLDRMKKSDAYVEFFEKRLPQLIEEVDDKRNQPE